MPQQLYLWSLFLAFSAEILSQYFFIIIAFGITLFCLVMIWGIVFLNIHGNLYRNKQKEWWEKWFQSFIAIASNITSISQIPFLHLYCVFVFLEKALKCSWFNSIRFLLVWKGKKKKNERQGIPIWMLFVDLEFQLNEQIRFFVWFFLSF